MKTIVIDYTETIRDLEILSLKRKLAIMEDKYIDYKIKYLMLKKEMKNKLDTEDKLNILIKDLDKMPQKEFNELHEKARLESKSFSCKESTMNAIGTTLIDFPNTISSIIFFQGCNLRCPFCYNVDLIKYESFDMQKHKDYILQRSKYVKGIVLTGGEPLMQPNLKDFILFIRSLDLKVKLDTNGFYPDKLKDVLPLVDYVAMDIKASHDYNKATGVNDLKFGYLLQSLDILKAGNVPYELRTTVVPKIFKKESWEEDFKIMDNLVKDSPLYALQLFRGDKTLDEEFEGSLEYQMEDLEHIRSIMNHPNIVLRG